MPQEYICQEGAKVTTDISGYEIRNIAEVIGRQFINDRITDMECLALMRKLKSVYRVLNRVHP